MMEQVAVELELTLANGLEQLRRSAPTEYDVKIEGSLRIESLHIESLDGRDNHPNRAA